MIKALQTQITLTPNEKAKEIIFTHLDKVLDEIKYHNIVTPFTQNELYLVKEQITKRVTTINEKLGRYSITLNSKLGDF